MYIELALILVSRCYVLRRILLFTYYSRRPTFFPIESLILHGKRLYRYIPFRKVSLLVWDPNTAESTLEDAPFDTATKPHLWHL